ncbi:hypothetical protein LINGRAHAP2_LOCUS32055 [Linum grandiflorum]
MLTETGRAVHILGQQLALTRFDRQFQQDYHRCTISTLSQTAKEKLAWIQKQERASQLSSSRIKEGDEVESVLRRTLIIGHKQIEEDE